MIKIIETFSRISVNDSATKTITKKVYFLGILIYKYESEFGNYPRPQEKVKIDNRVGFSKDFSKETTSLS